jgi:hypothetical protein
LSPDTPLLARADIIERADFGLLRDAFDAAGADASSHSDIADGMAGGTGYLNFVAVHHADN